MKLPSLSIAEMMAIVAMVALDCLVIRVASSGSAIPFFVVGGSPMQVALVIGLLLMFRRRRRMEKPFPFLIGFEVVGWIAHLVYVVLCLQAANSIDTYLRAILTPLLNATGFQRFSTPDMIYRFILGTSFSDRPPTGDSLGWGMDQPEVVEADSS